MSSFLDFVNQNKKNTFGQTTSPGSSNFIQSISPHEDPQGYINNATKQTGPTYTNFVSDPSILNQKPQGMARTNQVTKGIGTGLIDQFAGEGANALKKATNVDPKASIHNLLPGLFNPKTYVQTAKDIGNLIKGLGGAAYSDATFLPQALANTTVGFGKEILGTTGDLMKGRPLGAHSALTAGIDNAMANPDKGQAFADVVSHTLSQIAPYLIAGEGVQDLPNNVNTIPGVKASTGALTDKYLGQIKEQWSQPSSSPKSTFKNAKQVFDNAKLHGNDVSQTLTENKLNPSDHIVNGTYDTVNSANQIRSDAGKMSNEMLRPALQRAEQTTPPVNVNDLIGKTIDAIKSDRFTTPGQSSSLIKKIQSEGEALSSKYGDGMKLTDLLDNKIAYDSNAGYKFNGSIEDNLTAQMNKAFADVMRSTLEKTAPPEVPVGAFNAELAKQYQAANYLQELHGKKAPVSPGSVIRKYGGKLAGAGLAHTMGGGLLADVAGYHLGGMLEATLEKMPNPLRAFVLDNLKVSNPAAFQAVSDFVNAPQPNFPQLPASSTIFGQPNTPPESTMTITPAEPQIYRDPKTGKMQKGFKSTSSGFQIPK